MSDGDRGKKFSKRLANRKVRQLKLFNFGTQKSCWKTLHEQWDICDYNFRLHSHEECMEWCLDHWMDPSPWFQSYAAKRFGSNLIKMARKDFWKYAGK